MAEARRVYARQAQDYELSNRAAEIRIRAERRLGEMLKVQKEAGLMNKGKLKCGKELPQSQGDTTEAPTLAEVGISKTLSSRSQKIASMPTVSAIKPRFTEYTGNNPASHVISLNLKSFTIFGKFAKSGWSIGLIKQSIHDYTHTFTSDGL